MRRQLRVARLKHRQRLLVTSEAKKLFNSVGVAPVPFKVRASTRPTAPTDVILAKSNGQITAFVNQNWNRYFLTFGREKLATYVYWLSQTDDRAREIVVDISDGNLPGVARYKFSAASSQYTLLPDLHFFRAHGYAQTDQFAVEHAPAWNDRQDDIIWRGGLNGTGHFSLDPWAADNPGVIQRLRMALKCRELDVDFKFIFNPMQNYCEILRNADLTGDVIPTHDWGGMKYAIDIDGFTNAWCNLMQRLKLGCCVLKVESPFGYKQWYYDQLIPWRHFVPISADLSDLSEKIDWVRTHQTEARDIARRGQTFAKGLTFESETNFAVQAIEEREKRA
jgi:hypothetical protein